MSRRKYPNQGKSNAQLRAERLVLHEPERTHWDECWRVHPLCRLALAADLLAGAQESLYVLKEIVKEMEMEFRGRRK